jgi:hypothetical protein
VRSAKNAVVTFVQRLWFVRQPREIAIVPIRRCARRSALSDSPKTERHVGRRSGEGHSAGPWPLHRYRRALLVVAGALVSARMASSVHGGLGGPIVAR